MHSPTHRLVSRAFPLTLLLMLFISVLFGDRPAWLPFTEFEFESEAEEEHGATPDAEEMYYEMRAYPLKTIPLGARLQALEQLELNEVRQRQTRERLYGKKAVQLIELSQPQWEAVGRTFGPRQHVAEWSAGPRVADRVVRRRCRHHRRCTWCRPHGGVHARRQFRSD